MERAVHVARRHAAAGGPTLNPSTYELLAGIHDVPAEEVVVLPNSPNVLMAAERAAELSEKSVCVVPTRSQQAGLAAAVALDPTRGAGRERRGDARGARARAHGRGHRAPRATTPSAAGALPPRRRGRLRRRALVAWGEPAETLEAVLGELGREAELVTLIAGDGAPLDDDAVAALAPDGVELEYSLGRPARLLVADRRRVAGRAPPARSAAVRAPPIAFASSDRLLRAATQLRAERRAARCPRPSRLADAAGGRRPRRPRRAPSGSGC